MPKPERLNLCFLKRFFKKSEAFTIVEILIFIAISSVMAVILWRLFSNTFTSVNAGTRHVHITRYFRLAMMYLKDDLSNAVSFEIYGNKGEKIEINKIAGIDAGGKITLREVTYWNESGNIRRMESGVKTLIGNNKQVDINFYARKNFVDGPDYSKYEAEILLSGKNIVNENEMDSIEVVVVPQMMIKNKTMDWTPNPEPDGH
jgi:Tfp pilus assembly protein FimT